MTRRLAFVLSGVVIAALGCGSDATSPRTDMQFASVKVPGDTIVFQGLDNPGDESWLKPFSAHAFGDAVQIEGSFLAPCNNFPTLEGRLVVEKNVVTLTVSTPDLRVCADMPQPFHYNAYVTGLEPGMYTVRIRHKDDMHRGFEEHTVFTDTITKG